MDVTFSEKERGTVYLHNVPTDDFNEWRYKTDGAVVDIGAVLCLTFKICAVEIKLFSDKPQVEVSDGTPK